jgi:ABC-type iron transport system FetAB permease component
VDQKNQPENKGNILAGGNHCTIDFNQIDVLYRWMFDNLRQCTTVAASDYKDFFNQRMACKATWVIISWT